ncbi:MAG: hypothetical protein ACKVOW_00420, partial [Chitinophagaceae bacterium]
MYTIKPVNTRFFSTCKKEVRNLQLLQQVVIKKIMPDLIYDPIPIRVRAIQINNKSFHMKKIIILLLALYCSIGNSSAQKKSATEKVVETSEKINKKSKEISEASNKVSDQAQQVGQHAQNISTNVKIIYRVIEPILQHFKRKKKIGGTNSETVTNTNTV